jgi:PAS domain S-box-containing protein
LHAVRPVQRGYSRYALAAIAAAAALLLRGLLAHYIGAQHTTSITLWLAVVWSAWYGGLGPSIVTTLLSAAGFWYWFVPPYHAFAWRSRGDLFGFVSFLIASSVIVVLAEVVNRTVNRLTDTEDELRKAQQELESRVRQRTEELERKSAEFTEKAHLLDSVNDAIFVRSAEDTISYWSRGAERLYGWSEKEALGRSPHDLLHTEFPVPLEEVKKRESWTGELRHTRRDGTVIVVASRWTAVRDSEGKVVGWLEINNDITAQKRAEEAARRLSARILNLQDSERRRIARDLHDSLGQDLAALKISLDFLSASGVNPAMLEECTAVLDKCLAEIRTMSYLLHPPLLDEAGFASAARWYVDGFADRSGLKVGLEIPEDLDRLDPDIEVALFRVLQEALTNVYRHANSSSAEIRIHTDATQIRLEIQDHGKGIPQPRSEHLMEGSSHAGVGIAGMRERMRELGGVLTIESGGQGTLIVASVPVNGKVQTRPASRVPSNLSISATLE